MLPLNTKLPAFSLPDLDGRTVSSEQFANAPGLLVAFICTHCPYVKHIKSEFARFAREYRARGLAVVAVASNDASTHPDDGPAGLAKDAKEHGYDFPYLYDESQAVARAYNAQCTPDFFLYTKDRQLAYRGQMDDSRPGNGKPVTGADLTAAVDAVLAGKPVEGVQKPSMGCNIKWR